tara:strand:+ start:357 stop:530 length:174 start_codon:yes stop_codon:yes gene_type:complete
MIIANAKYYKNLEGENSTISVDIDNQSMFVPLDPANRHYAEILKQVEAGTLTVEDAD